MNKFCWILALAAMLCSCEEPASSSNMGEPPTQSASASSSAKQEEDLDTNLFDGFDRELLSAMNQLYEGGALNSSITLHNVNEEKMLRVIGSSKPKNWKLLSVPSLFDDSGTKFAACIIERNSKLNSSTPAPHLDIWYKAPSGSWMFKLEENGAPEILTVFTTGYVEEEVIVSSEGRESKVSAKMPILELKSNLGNGMYFWSQINAEDSEHKTTLPNYKLISGKTPSSWADPPSGCQWITAPITYRHSRERKIVEDNASQRTWTATNKIVWRRYYINKSDGAKQ